MSSALALPRRVLRVTSNLPLSRSICTVLTSPILQLHVRRFLLSREHEGHERIYLSMRTTDYFVEALPLPHQLVYSNNSRHDESIHSLNRHSESQHSIVPP